MTSTQKTYRYNPFRSQIDYIIASTNLRKANTNARAYGGLNTSTDHKIVISEWRFNQESWKKIYNTHKNQKTKSVQVYHLKDFKENYSEQIDNKLCDFNNLNNLSPQDY